MTDTADINVIKQPVRSIPALLRLGSQPAGTVKFTDNSGYIIDYVRLLNMTLIQLMELIHNEDLFFETKI